MDLDKESPTSIFVGDGMSDDMLPPPSNAPRREVKLPPESSLARGARIGAVTFIALWVVAGIMAFIVR